MLPVATRPRLGSDSGSTSLRHSSEALMEDIFKMADLLHVEFIVCFLIYPLAYLQQLPRRGVLYYLLLFAFFIHLLFARD